MHVQSGPMVHAIFSRLMISSGYWHGHLCKHCKAMSVCGAVQDSSALALQVAVLMIGPRGSGRATAVRAAVTALGIHLVPFSCHDLKGQTDAQTATALKAAVEAPQDFSPAVRHFEVLAGSPTGATQGTDRCCTKCCVLGCKQARENFCVHL